MSTFAEHPQLHAGSAHSGTRNWPGNWKRECRGDLAQTRRLKKVGIWATHHVSVWSQRRRIVQDISRITRDPPHGVKASPFSDNMMYCHAIINGPEDTMWETGTFHLLIKFTEDYPTSPPNVRFLTRMYHPNIYSDGKICLDILQNQWSAMYDIAAVLTSIQSLLSDPNPDSPANPQAAKMLVNNKVEYDRLVLMLVLGGCCLSMLAFQECVEDSWAIPNLPEGTFDDE